MFYPCFTDLSNTARVKQGVIVLTPSESKRLLAKAVVSLPEVQWAYAHGRLAVTSGATDCFVLEERHRRKDRAQPLLRRHERGGDVDHEP